MKISIKDLSFQYRDRPILKKISLDIPQNTITSITGPSGQGKSSFLMTMNRLWENFEGAHVSGDIHIDFGKGLEPVNHSDCDLPRLRQKAAMVFQVPNPLPTSIYKNMSFPLKLAGIKDRDLIFKKAVHALKKANLWDEVKERLDENASLLSGGQQQRLCIARALVLDPQILLLDEPTSSLDQDSVGAIETLLLTLKKDCTIIMVSHYMDQIKRIADQAYILSDQNLVPAPL